MQESPAFQVWQGIATAYEKRETSPQERKWASELKEEPPKPYRTMSKQTSELAYSCPNALFLLPVSHWAQGFVALSESFPPCAVCAPEGHTLISQVIRDHTPRKELGSKIWDTKMMQKEEF